MENRKLERDLENNNGGAGVYSASLRKHYILTDDEWKEDIMPEILDGHNVYDFVDPDILQRLEELEREEGLWLEAELLDVEFEINGKELTPEEREALAEIRKKKSLLIHEHRIKKSTAESRPTIPRNFDEWKFTTERMGRQLSFLGLDPASAINRARSRSISRKGRKRDRSFARDGDDDEAMDIDDDEQKSKKLRMRSRSRSHLRPPSKVIPVEGLKDSTQKLKAIKIKKKSEKVRNKAACRGEADRVIPNLKPKHLFSGKRSIGKTQRR